MLTSLIVAVVILWLLLGHAMRFLLAVMSGGYALHFHWRAYCYLLAPIAAVHIMFDNVPNLVVNWFRRTDASNRDQAA